MKKVILKNLKAYCLSVEEKKNVVGGGKLKPEPAGPLMCVCGMDVYVPADEYDRCPCWCVPEQMHCRELNVL